MLSGDNGILQKATDAKQISERVEAKEQAQMDIMAWITDKTANHESSSLDDSKVKTILTGKSYVKEAKDSSFITTKGEYEISYSELYIYTASDTTQIATLPAGTYTAGQEVELAGEKFFVIADDGDSVKLLAKYCLSKTENVQLTKDATTTDYGRSFSSTAYWSSDSAGSSLELQGTYLANHPLSSSETEENNAIKKAQSYGIAKGVIGRLITYEEAYGILNGSNDTLKNILRGNWTDATSRPTQGYLDWWIGTASGWGTVYNVRGGQDWFVQSDDDYGNNYYWTNYGVRPVLIVPES